MIPTQKQLIIFDLDDTLNVSKSAIDHEMADLLMKLLALKKVAVISGGNFPQFQIQFLGSLPSSFENFSNLYLLPTSGTRMYVWKGRWTQLYAEDFTKKDKDQITKALESSLISAGYVKPQKIWGEIIEDRESQITFSALGQKAPPTEKYAWDPDRKKREAIVKYLAPKLPKFDVRIGGTTSIDITHKGVNKAYGIRKLEHLLDLGPEQISFVGDALFYGGNDYPARATGVDCFPVKNPEETKSLIRDWIDNHVTSVSQKHTFYPGSQSVGISPAIS